MRWKNLWVKKWPLCRVPFDDDGGTNIFKKCDYIPVIWAIQYAIRCQTKHTWEIQKNVSTDSHFFASSKIFMQKKCDAEQLSWIHEYLSTKKECETLFDDVESTVRVTSVLYLIWKCKTNLDSVSNSCVANDSGFLRIKWKRAIQ